MSPRPRIIVAALLSFLVPCQLSFAQGSRTPLNNPAVQSDINMVGHTLTNLGGTGGLAVTVNAQGTVTNVLPVDFPPGQLEINGAAIDTDLAGKQPIDPDLTAIAALATDPFGRGLLTKADAAAVRTYIGAGTSSFDGTFASLGGKPTTIGGFGITDFNSLGDARWPLLSGSYVNPSWLVSLPFSKITSTPTTIAGYNITDFNSLGDARWPLLSGSYANPSWITSLPFSKVSNTPTTIAGYGLTTDLLTIGDGRWAAFDHVHGEGDVTDLVADLADINTELSSHDVSITSLGNTKLTKAANLSDLADAAAARTNLALVPGTNVQAFDADLTALAALSGTNTIYYRSGANTWTAVTIASPLTFSGGALGIDLSAFTAADNALDARLDTLEGETVDITDPGYDFILGYDTTANTYVALQKSLFVVAGTINWPGTLYTTPTTGSVSAGALTFAPALATQTQKTFLAGPTSGSAAAPTFRAIAAADVPDLSATYQPLDADLTALAATSGTNTIYYRSAANTWTPVTIGSGVSFSGGTLSATSSSGNLGDDGWITTADTWTYASATTFTITGDRTASLQKGDKLKLTQTTVKYFYVIGVSYSSPNTTVTVTAGDDYTLANAAITAPYFAHSTSPNGFPAYFNYTPTWTGFSSPPSAAASSGEIRFVINGSTCRYSISPANDGTSNATTMTATLPVACAVRTDLLLRVRNNSAWLTTAGWCYANAGATVLTFHKDPSSGTWTASGTKNACGVFIYEF